MLQIFISLVVLSVAQAALVTRIPKPNLNSLFSGKSETPEFPKHKSPEERRKFSLFPKSYMKYVISLEPIYKIATHKPIVRRTKNPLMKKLNLHDKKNVIVENETEQPISNPEPKYENTLAVNPKMDNVEASEEVSIEVFENKPEESNEKQNDDSEEETKLKNDNSEESEKHKNDDTEEEDNHKNDDGKEEDKLKNDESVEEDKRKNDDSEKGDKPKNDGSEEKLETATPDTENQDKIILGITIFPPAVHNEFSSENKNLDAFADVVNKNGNSKEIETSDWTEFILVDPTQKPTESDIKISSEEPEEFITTEMYEELENVRVKR